jgi:hypothetical protein
LDEVSTPLDAPPLCGLPRRFSMRGLLIIMTLAALLMGFLRTCGASASVYFMVVTFVIGTLAAQVVLFRGLSPAKASMWAGGLLLPLETLAVVLYWYPYSQVRPEAIESLIVGCVCMSAVLVPVGAILGAVAGMLGGGLYLLSEELLLWLTRGVPKVALEPVEAADADVLLCWIRGPQFCWRWAGVQLTWPLDCQQLLDRFATAQGEQPSRCIFKAVDLRTGEVVGYVELGRIDPLTRCAALELPLVDPGASERGRVGVLLLQAIGKRAFGKMGILSLAVDDDPDQSELGLCCHAAWQAICDYQARPEEGDVVWSARNRTAVAGLSVPGGG